MSEAMRKRVGRYLPSGSLNVTKKMEAAAVANICRQKAEHPAGHLQWPTVDVVSTVD